VIAGPNGAGKTTFALEFLPREAGVVHFVNADLIAAGLSPFRPSMAALSAGRVFLRELDRLAASRCDFAFESTLSGRATSAASGDGREPAIASSSSSCVWHLRSRRCTGSRPESGRAATMCRRPTCSGDSAAAG
jgi:hypothetical protein